MIVPGSTVIGCAVIVTAATVRVSPIVFDCVSDEICVIVAVSSLATDIITVTGIVPVTLAVISEIVGDSNVVIPASESADTVMVPSFTELVKVIVPNSLVT